MSLDQDKERLWEDLNRLYSDNEKIIKKCEATDVRALAREDRLSDLDVAIESFNETANLILSGLVALGNVHPILGGILSFSDFAILSADLRS